MRIYVAGPISNGGTIGDAGQIANVDRASEIAMYLLLMGHIPYWPHGNFMFGKRMETIGYKLDEEFYLYWDFAWLRMCDGLFYIAPSSGADRELALAESLGMTIFRDLSEVPVSEYEDIFLTRHACVGGC